MTNRWIDNMPAEQYHADPCDTPSLSSSIARLLLQRSPWHAWRAHPRFGNVAGESTDEQDRGAIVHALLLGERHRIEVIDAADYKTKASRELRDAAIAAGQIPVKAAHFADCSRDAETIRANLSRYKIHLDDGYAERVALWSEDGVQCRARMDYVHGSIIYDIKTTRDGDDTNLERTIRKYDYHVQAAAYVSAFEYIEPRLAGRVRFVFLFVEHESLDVIPAELAGDLAELGRSRWQRAVDAWGRCLRADQWPRYAPREVRRLECSEWARTADQVDAATLRERMIGI
jgi:hypothetical protein